MALACHELGHALATKHAGRRVPAAGFLVYFGIPSVFVDTTDVWMAGRRARIADHRGRPGHRAGAGRRLASWSGWSCPTLAPWCFKLSFAWYLNALFNLNPFLALDGYYLLMDWLEVPNLRARGLAWVVARLRRRPPRWASWTARAGWSRCTACSPSAGCRSRPTSPTGSTPTGSPGWSPGCGAPAGRRRVLLARRGRRRWSRRWSTCVFGWLRRRWPPGPRDRLARAHAEPRRAPPAGRAARLRRCGDLPDAALADLAAQARWVHPRTGEQLVFAGAAQPDGVRRRRRRPGGAAGPATRPAPSGNGSAPAASSGSPPR